MAVEDRIRTLQQKHANLDQALLREAARALPDDTKVMEIKREKLRIKDSIVELSRTAHA